MNASKQATHTPGPLDVYKCATPDYAPQFTLYDSDGRRVATVFSEADANLFAAAPDLLAALRAQTRHMEELDRLTRNIDLRIHPDARNLVAAMTAVVRLAQAEGPNNPHAALARVAP